MNNFKKTVGLLSVSVVALGLAACSASKNVQKSGKVNNGPTYSQVTKKAEDFDDYKSLSLVATVTQGKKKVVDEKMDYVDSPETYYISLTDTLNSNSKPMQIWKLDHDQAYIRSQGMTFKTKKYSKATGSNTAMAEMQLSQVLNELPETFKDKSLKKSNWKIDEQQENYVMTYTAKEVDLDDNNSLIQDSKLGTELDMSGKAKNVTFKVIIAKGSGQIKEIDQKYDFTGAKDKAYSFNATMKTNNLSKITVPKSIKANAMSIDSRLK